MGFGERLRDARLAKKMSGAELGKRVAKRVGAAKDIARQTVSHWETDRHPPALPELIAICEELNVSMDRLAFGVAQTLSLEALKIASLAEALPSAQRNELIERLTVIDRGPRVFAGVQPRSEEEWTRQSHRSKERKRTHNK